jgi:hypothetical protein
VSGTIHVCKRCNRAWYDKGEAENCCGRVESALDTQVGGGHYKARKIQPVEFIHANGLGFCEGNVVKYVTRWKDKGGVADLEKARHYLDLLIELEKRNAAD